MIRDLAGYRVYRSEGSSFGSATKVADETALFPQPSPAYPDSQVVNCRRYNYWITAVDACGLESPASAEVSGQATTDVAPLAPSGVQDYLDLGLHGWAMSRYSGCWVAFKAVPDTIESSASVYIDPHRVNIAQPDYALPPGDPASPMIRDLAVLRRAWTLTLPPKDPAFAVSPHPTRRG